MVVPWGRHKVPFRVEERDLYNLLERVGQAVQQRRAEHAILQLLRNTFGGIPLFRHLEVVDLIQEQGVLSLRVESRHRDAAPIQIGPTVVARCEKEDLRIVVVVLHQEVHDTVGGLFAIHMVVDHETTVWAYRAILRLRISIVLRPPFPFFLDMAFEFLACVCCLRHQIDDRIYFRVFREATDFFDDSLHTFVACRCLGGQSLDEAEHIVLVDKFRQLDALRLIVPVQHLFAGPAREQLAFLAHVFQELEPVALSSRRVVLVRAALRLARDHPGFVSAVTGHPTGARRRSMLD